MWHNSWPGVADAGGWLRNLAPLYKAYYENDDFGFPAIQRPPDGLLASRGRTGRIVVVRNSSGGSKVTVRYCKERFWAFGRLWA